MENIFALKTYCPRCSSDYIVNLPLTCSIVGLETVLLQDGWDLALDGPMVICPACAKTIGGGGDDSGERTVPSLDRL
jgi:hypothetical protein